MENIEHCDVNTFNNMTKQLTYDNRSMCCSTEFLMTLCIIGAPTYFMIVIFRKIMKLCLAD